MSTTISTTISTTRIFTKRVAKRVLERREILGNRAPFGDVSRKIEVVVESGAILRTDGKKSEEEEEMEREEDKVDKVLQEPPVVRKMLVNLDLLNQMNENPQNHPKHSILELTEEMKKKMTSVWERTLHVSNLSQLVNECNLRWLFSHYGKIQKLYLPRQRFQTITDEDGNEIHPLRGFAFITFHSLQDAMTAKQKLDNYGWQQMIIHVEKATVVCSSYTF
jgi:hypothetical protein